jgi:outer membrane biogenesis lipoprotein LolB
MEMGNVLVREFMILFSVWLLLSGCANTKPSEQADSDSILRKSESDYEVHGEVGVMYGQTAR